MPKICYVSKRFSDGTQKLIDQANKIIDSYARQGFVLTLRQLYYQFVARDLIANKSSEYDRLGAVINDARLAGEIDWNHIVDRTRNLRANSHWDAPAAIIESAARSYALDKWRDQPYYVEVWIEKDALVGVIEGICQQLDVAYFSCRGYTSQSEMWGAAQRILREIDFGRTPVIVHLGDHDPSGKDMTRDIADRLELFCDQRVEVHRIALNWDQIEQFRPPPNPAKVTDSRAAAYIAEFGSDSWELDALEPRVLAGLVRTAVEALRDDERWAARVEQEKTERGILQSVQHNWDRVAGWIASSLRSLGTEGATDEEV